jgi:hypothetical protein
LRIYGDGSAGARTISANTTLVDENMQYASFTVQAGVTVTIPSGTTMRCTGRFENHGTIVVATGERGGGAYGALHMLPGQGIAHAPANAGPSGDASLFYFGSPGGGGLSLAEARTLLHPGPAGGGGGAAPSVPLVAYGGAGGGTFTVLAHEGITNDAGASILADGQAAQDQVFDGGGGGGGGGIVILASPAYVENLGTVTTKGGNGGHGDTAGGGVNTTAGGGGGGGGIVHILAPDSVLGTVVVSGGAGGAADSQAAGPTRCSGGGGGACGGSGGSGGAITSGVATAGGGDAGTDGYFIVTKVDPTSLF